MDTQSPRRLGRYQLLERIAVGGMAEVYKAVAQGLSGFEKTVVVKRLLPQHQRDQDLLTMFVDEARLLGRLRHPNIAEVYDIDHEGNEYFFALEYVDGVELRALLNEQPGQPLSVAESLLITIELASALGYAHGLTDDDGSPLGIVHRDVSPSNVLISQTGAVKLVDFGVAKWRTQRSETRHGVLKGKVNYMSPEQCRGEPLDQRSDVFALGVLLYEMSVGVRPFAGSSDFETLKAIAEGHYIKPSAKLPGYPAALEDICVAMLELQPEQRLRDMGEVVSAVQAYADAAGIPLDVKPLAMRASTVRTRIDDSASHDSCRFLTPQGSTPAPVRLAVDRTATATATATINSFAPSARATPAAEVPHHRSARSGAVALLAVVAGILILVFAMRPWDRSSTQTAPPNSASTKAPGIAIVANAPAQPPAPTKPAPVLPSGTATLSSPSPKRTSPGRLSASDRERKEPALPAAAVPEKALSVPSAAAVWDPDSPVPP